MAPVDELKEGHNQRPEPRD